MRPAWVAALCFAASPAFAATNEQVLDDFTDASRWEAIHSEDVQASLHRDARGGLCLRYDFGKVSGYAGLRRALPLALPENYAFTLAVRGRAPVNAFQMKLIDASGDNVWWLNKPDFAPPLRRTEMTIRKRQIEFAWGPTTDRGLKQSATLEFVVGSGASGGHGEVCFDRLAMRTLPVPPPFTPGIVSASSVLAGHAAGLAVDADAATSWQSADGARARWQVDLGVPRELNGLLLRWAEGRRARDFDLQFSDDGRQWRTVRRVRGNERDLLPLWLPERETRHVRIAMLGGPEPRYALADVKIESPEQWPTLNSAMQSLAEASPRGRMPRAFIGQQNYWTLVGVDGDGANSALISEDGAIEPHRGGPSIEPFVIDDSGRALGWADMRIAQSLRDGYLPLPSVHWHHEGFDLTVETGAEGPRPSSRLLARYRLTNTGKSTRRLTLALALRPWQVNPPAQFLNTRGGTSSIGRVDWTTRSLSVDGRSWLTVSTPPAGTDARAFGLADALDVAGGEGAKTSGRLVDPQSMATAVMRWPMELAAGESREVAVELPLSATSPSKDSRDVGQRLDAIADQWRARLNRATLTLPPDAQPLADTLRSSLAHILMSRDGPALQPGTRSYARSWVRDGAMMVAGLLRLGEVDAAREFVQWYAGHLFANGKVPCCVDRRGSDPVVENDSHGEFIFSVAELWRHTHDRALIEPLWPKVDAAVTYMESLRQSERTSANRQPGRESWFGLMPKSISHEGYSAAPMHAYWDDFWAMAGYRDAADLAQALGKTDRAAELGRQRDEFASELAASLVKATAEHRIDFLPGAAELGDFDPSSSTMIFSPAGIENRVPRALLEGTWERAWIEFIARREGRRDWKDYTPYEWRSVGAYARLGQPERAHALVDFYLHDRRPATWNQWAEVVGRDAREPRFIGDMPHAWISSDYIRSVLDLLAHVRESDQALVIGAGIKRSWLTHGVWVAGLSTPYGRLGFRLRQEGRDVMLSIEPGLRAPPGGIRLAWPGSDSLPIASIDGRRIEWMERELRMPDGATVLKLALP